MLRTLKQWFGKEKPPPKASPPVADQEVSIYNHELLAAIKTRNQLGTPESFKRFYDVLLASSLVVALPPHRADLVETFVDRLQTGEGIELDGISGAPGRMSWGVSTHEAALHCWRPKENPCVCVPARDVLWTAQRNGLTLVINPHNPPEIHVSLSSEEIASLSEERYPRAAEAGNRLVNNFKIGIFPLDAPLNEASHDLIKRALVSESTIARAYVFKAQIGYQRYFLALGLEFDIEVDQKSRNEVCARLNSRGEIVLKDATEMAIIPMWEAIIELVAKEGVKVYDRSETVSQIL